MFRIGEFSRLSFISMRMLRHYHDIGLLIPAQIDSATGYRYYTASQLLTARRIQALRGMGFSLGTIGDLLRDAQDPDALRERFTQRKRELVVQLEQMNGQLSLLDSALTQLGKEVSIMSFDILVKEIPARQVGALRKIIPSYQQEGELWSLFYQESAPQHLQFASPCYAIATFYDEGFQEENVDVEIQQAVVGSYQDTAHIRFRQEPAQQVASVTIRGAYEQVSDVCTAVALWVEKNSYRFCGPMFNIYVVSPAQDPNPDNWVTEVCFPIQKA